MSSSPFGYMLRLVCVALSCLLLSTQAQAIVYNVYNNTDPAYLGDGSELVDALVTPGSGINVMPDSAAFQGNFSDPSLGGEFLAGVEVVEPTIAADNSYGSAAFYTDLNFGSLDGTDFVLPDGILLTSGHAAPADTNTVPDYTGLASGNGDQGLDQLLQTLPPTGEHVSTDATVLTFDFTVDPGVNAVSLDFIFGTEEYSEYIDDYPEIAAVFVDGVNYAGFSDGSLLTLTGTTVGSGNFYNNDIHDGGAPVDAFGESPLDIEYDGVSAPLTVVGLLDTGQEVHTIKIAVSDTNDEILDTGLFVANMQGLELTGGTSPDDPLLPVPTPGEPGFEFVVDVGDTGVGIDPNFPIFIDPYVATGYTYEATGTNFATVMVPIAYGDGKYNLYYWDGTDYVFIQEIDTGVQYDFLALDPLGFSKFMIDGIEISAGLDPTDPTAFVTAVTFTGGGMITVTQTPIQTCDGAADCAAVPEPNVVLLLAIGMLGMGLLRRSS